VRIELAQDRILTMKTMEHQCVIWTETAYNNVNTVISEYLGSTAGENLH